jgi:Flp pilus assembly CpaF family ATPase
MQIRSRVVVAGAPTAGKTTMTNALLAAIPATRVVRVNEEDRELYAELMLGGYAMASDRPGQTLRDLIKLDLRFRPDILVVGEVRGGEAFELLRPLNAGVGLLTTVHSNQASDTIDALATAATHAGEKIGDDTLRRLFAAAIDFVVFCDADEPLDGSEAHKRRQVTEISWVSPQLAGGNVVYEPIFRREALGQPLRWTGASPDAATTARIERALPPGVTLASLLDGATPLWSAA